MALTSEISGSGYRVDQRYTVAYRLMEPLIQILDQLLPFLARFF